MLCFPNAKLNLGLHVTRKREDGFHELETLMLPFGWQDALEILEAKKTRLEVYNIALGGKMEENLVYQAFRLLRQDHDLPELEIYLYKNIPFGAGLGGGSADAAFMLKLLNKTFTLGLGDQNLEQYAAKLGSDCAFFIRNRPMLATGRGEVLVPFELKLPWKHLAVVKPDFGVSTKEAYAGIVPKKPQKALSEVLAKPETWQTDLVNDFEATVLRRYPELAQHKAELYRLGAGYAAMSGSGSALFAFSDQALDLGGFQAKGFRVFQESLKQTKP